MSSVRSSKLIELFLKFNHRSSSSTARREENIVEQLTVCIVVNNYDFVIMVWSVITYFTVSFHPVTGVESVWRKVPEASRSAPFSSRYLEATGD